MPDENATKGYISVELKDLHTHSDLTFDLYIYLPRNQKFILYRKKDSRLEADKKQKLEAKQGNLYVKEADKDAYLKFVSQQFTNVLKNNNLSETEKRTEVKKVAKNLLEDVFAKKKKEDCYNEFLLH